MPSEEDLRNADFHNEELSDKISEEGREKLKELKARLDMNIKEAYESPLEDIGDLNKEKAKALEEFMKDRNDGPPFGNMPLTPEQRVEQEVNKRLSELEERVQKLESFIFREFTKGGSQ